MNRFDITASAPDKKAFSLLHYTKADGIPAKQGIALWACDDCKTEVVGNHAVLFSCPCCAGNMTAGNTAEMNASELKDAHHIADCGFCGSTLVSAVTSTAQFTDKNLYCPVCSDTVAVADDAATPDMSSDKDAGKTDDTDDLGDDAPESDDDLPEGEDESDDSEDESDDKADDEEDADDESEDDAENDETDTSDDSTKKTTTASDDKTDDADDSDDSDSEDDTTEDSSSEDDAEGDDPDSDDDAASTKKDETVNTGTGKSTLSASLLAAMAGKETDINIVQSPDRTKWYMFADNTPVAVSEASRCQENLRGTFSTNQFATAFVASTDKGVTQEILEEFGFEPVITKVSVDEAARQHIEAQIKEKTEAHTMTAAAYGDRFQQCFGMAAAGMPKNFFKGDRNPVQKSLIASLNKIGVRDAANIVTKAFENQGKTLYKTLVLRANDLMNKDDKTLDEIANLIEDRETSFESEAAPSTPIAALASMEEEIVKPAVAILASDSQDDDVFSTYFQRARR